MKRQTKILFSVPNMGNITTETSFAVAQLCQRPDIRYIAVQGQPIDQVRNRLMRHLLMDYECTHILMLDSDVVPPDDIVDLLLECDAPIASAIVPIMLQGAIVANVGKDSKFLVNWSGIDKPFDVDVCGAGCVLIRRDVAETVPWPWFRDREDKTQNSRIGEDVYFCHKAGKYGFTIKAHPDAVCGHLKRMNLLDVVRAVNAARQQRQEGQVA